MRVTTLISALALTLSVNACANNETDNLTASIAAPLANQSGGWASINQAGQLMIDNTVVVDYAQLLDTMPLNATTLVATTVGIEAAAHVYRVSDQGTELIAALPSPEFLPETLCLAPAGEDQAALFVVDERGKAEHWLVSVGNTIEPVKVRDLSIAPNSIACDADQHGGIFAVEEEVGIWRYQANPELPPGRELIDLAAPRGQLPGGAEALAVVGDEVVAIAAESKEVLAYRQTDAGWEATRIGQWDGLTEAENLHAWIKDGKLHLVVRDDATGQSVQKTLDYQPIAKPVAQKSIEVARVQPTMQTEPVERFGDAADDPAIWVHPSRPAHSRILGTDKKHGLAVYDLQGTLLSMLPTGRLNNVDLRYGFDFGNGVADIAVASQRNDNSLSVYRIHPTEGSVTHLAELPTGLEEIYGLCMYQNNEATYAIANGKSGRFEQYRLHADNGDVTATLAREFAVATQPEGCVADDARGRLFVGEEGYGVWTLSALAEDPAQLELVKGIDATLVADVEGMALYPAVNSQYLIVSSQGDNAYVVLSAHAPYKVLGKFSVGNNLAAGIDAISETDGLEVTHRSLGKGLEKGAFVAQDGHNVIPEQPQNFKLVPWQAIAKELELNE
ncbi:phytase [Gilvimarinus agarilyticus]|uniref:phytase n=1 Tax=Gilvimarinus sp. 2_MG-2023 TaxID=3062666 RepID=UPI001C090298|nr:phytase [Gilvimarinus sp. 2_MG-2023]MBU2886685.1 phytase [Gilvimarinus agarilyticus]MDO6571353.1 phytase [Gilvimarinus sp. 2_MG-2023]